MRWPRQDVGRFRFFRWWLHRSIRRMRGWDFGFYICPIPREEHREGDMIQAALLLDGFVCLKPWQWRVYLWSADPANRPIGENAPQ